MSAEKLRLTDRQNIICFLLEYFHIFITFTTHLRTVSTNINEQAIGRLIKQVKDGRGFYSNYQMKYILSESN